MICNNRPDVYLEIGSGNSTKFARYAIEHFNLGTRIISIDPEPRAEINALCDEIHRTALEDIDTGIFERLPQKTVLFIDSSHRAFQNSDTTVYFTEILPSLPRDTVFGVHDIFLPYDYPEHWIGEKRYYNEQYLLACWLLAGGGIDTVLPNAYTYFSEISNKVLADLWSSPEMNGAETFGCIYWGKRT